VTERFSLKDLRKQAAVGAALGFLFTLLMGLRNGPQFFRSYLLAYLIFFGLAVGCLGVLLTYLMTGGAWGRASCRVFLACVRTLPWTAVLFIPVLLGLRYIYPWTHIAQWTGYSAGHKRIFFNLPFFVIRSAVYFAFWCWCGARLQARARPGSEGIDLRGGRMLGGVGLVFYVLSVSFAAFDWIMSLEPYWASSIYGAMILMGHVLSAFAFALVVLAWLAQRSPEAFPVSDDAAHDLGNLLLAFVILWAYMALSQYLIIWSGNLPSEIPWYLARQRGGWQAVAVLLVLLQFFLPFFLLLARRNKRRLESLGKVALIVLVVRFIDVFWLVVPDFSPAKFSLHVADFSTTLLVGGLWLIAFCHGLQEEPAR